MTMYGTSADPLGSNTLIKSSRAMEYRGTDITVKVVIEKKVKDSRTVYGLAAGCGILSILLLGATVIIIRLRIKLRKSAASTPELMILAEAQNQQRLQR